MRFFILLLLSVFAFAAEPEIQLPSGKDLPGWAKELDIKFEAAWGDNAPWRKLEKPPQQTAAATNARSKAEIAYKEAYETALKNWSKTANVQKRTEKGPEAEDYNALLFWIKWRKDGKPYDSDKWQPYDEFFIQYAKFNNDQLALAFVWTPKNRAKYCH